MIMDATSIPPSHSTTAAATSATTNTTMIQKRVEAASKNLYAEALQLREDKARLKKDKATGKARLLKEDKLEKDKSRLKEGRQILAKISALQYQTVRRSLEKPRRPRFKVRAGTAVRPAFPTLCTRLVPVVCVSDARAWAVWCVRGVVADAVGVIDEFGSTACVLTSVLITLCVGATCGAADHHQSERVGDGRCGLPGGGGALANHGFGRGSLRHVGRRAARAATVALSACRGVVPCGRGGGVERGVLLQGGGPHCCDFLCCALL